MTFASLLIFDFRDFFFLREKPPYPREGTAGFTPSRKNSRKRSKRHFAFPRPPVPRSLPTETEQMSGPCAHHTLGRNGRGGLQEPTWVRLTQRESKCKPTFQSSPITSSVSVLLARAALLLHPFIHLLNQVHLSRIKT